MSSYRSSFLFVLPALVVIVYIPHKQENVRTIETNRELYSSHERLGKIIGLTDTSHL
ncbi:hypothetical protein KC19_VG213000 [Ceratodon purpureus]|uniref:Uncharacterized protein n=1 Tax=Ceratodon purpureus TaxID=3225 RepID=A0A8T0HSW0_CERPU|nr:hypothetical protein KC19_VG213000 [Ceratodon purpureus]